MTDVVWAAAAMVVLVVHLTLRGTVARDRARLLRSLAEILRALAEVVRAFGRN